MVFDLPRYFFICNRAVKLVESADGKMDCQVFSRKTGEFERDFEYLPELLLSDTNVDEVTVEEFNQRVEYYRQKLA